MTTTTYTSLEVAKLAAVITGGGYKRSASKEQAVARFLKIAEEAGIADAEALLDAERYGFDAAHHVLVERKKGGHASIPEVQADASLVEGDLQPGDETNEGEIGRWKQTDDGPVWTARQPVADANPAGTFVGSVTVEDGMNGKLFGGKSKKLAAVMGEPAPAAEPKADKAESKTAMLLRIAQTPEGITNAKMKELTGWTKLGGFFNAAQKAGLELTRVRENGETTWRAAPAAE